MEAAILIERMKRDHERVLRELAELERALACAAQKERWSGELGGLVEMLQRQFRTHMAAEDDILYPAIMRAIPASAGSLEPLADEHAELRQMLLRLRATLREPDGEERDEQIAIQVHDLAELLRLHIRKEESLVLSVAARLLRPEEIHAVLERMSAGSETKAAEPPLPLTKKGSSR